MPVSCAVFDPDELFYLKTIKTNKEKQMTTTPKGNK